KAKRPSNEFSCVPEKEASSQHLPGSPGFAGGTSTAFIEHFSFATLCASNHTVCRFREKRCFSTHFGPGGIVPPPRVFSFFKGKTL
ncbi:hypothetical protein, partial [uncultured Desulfovibrio sp.]|uniref:hypothetical protein n=1 Tax=uncultured Desulfovibrio sp. TaxID=167968 RepID=UPI002618EF32